MDLEGCLVYCDRRKKNAIPVYLPFLFLPDNLVLHLLIRSFPHLLLRRFSYTTGCDPSLLPNSCNCLFFYTSPYTYQPFTTHTRKLVCVLPIPFLIPSHHAITRHFVHHIVLYNIYWILDTYGGSDCLPSCTPAPFSPPITDRHVYDLITYPPTPPGRRTHPTEHT